MCIKRKNKGMRRVKKLIIQKSVYTGSVYTKIRTEEQELGPKFKYKGSTYKGKKIGSSKKSNF